MKKKGFGLVSIFVVFAIVMSACTRTPSTNTSGGSETSKVSLAAVQELRMVMDNDPASLDPQLCVDGNGGSVIDYMLEPLIHLDKYGKPYAGLAKSWSISADNLTYTFNIREDAKWADGKPLTAKDVYYTWFRAIDPKVASGNSYRFFGIVGTQEYFEGKQTDKGKVGVKLINDYTIEVKLIKAIPYFMELVTNNVYRPVREDFVLAAGDKFSSDPQFILSNGPFVLKEWKRAQQLVLEKNPNYWNAANIKLNKVILNIIPEPQVAIQMYESGEIDEVGVDASLIAKYQSNSDLKRVASSNIAFISFNTKDPFFSNLKIRKAFSMIMDREGFANKVLNNGSKAIRGFVPYNYPGIGDKDFRTTSGDHLVDISINEAKYSAEAVKLLDEGLKELGKTKDSLSKHLSILTFEEESKKQALVMQESYKKYFGLEAKVEMLTLKVLIDRMFSGNYSLLIIGFAGFYKDAMAYLENYTSDSSMNTSSFADKKYDALIAAARDLTGDARIQKLIEAEAYLMDQSPLAPVYNRAGNVLIKPYLKGIDTENIYGTDFTNIYIEKH